MRRYKVIDAIQGFLVKDKKSNQTVSTESGYSRSFKAALSNRFVDWILASRHKINVDLVNQLETLVTRSRSLAKNNEIFKSFLFNSKVSVVGPNGFTLAMQVKNSDGSLNEELNDEIEWAFEDFQKKENLTPSKTLGGVALDMQILENLIVDGEAFIQVVKDNKSPFGVRFRPIDAMSVDMHKLQITVLLMVLKLIKTIDLLDIG